MKKQQYILLGVVATFIVAGVLIYFGRKKAMQKKELIARIRLIIQRGIGADGEDAGKILLNSKPDPSYNATADAAKLIKAPGLLTDDNDAVFAILRGKTKRQLASIDQTLLRNHGQSLDQFLTGIFKEATDCRITGLNGCGYPNYDKALTMIKNAA